MFGIVFCVIVIHLSGEDPLFGISIFRLGVVLVVILFFTVTPMYRENLLFGINVTCRVYLSFSEGFVSEVPVYGVTVSLEVGFSSKEHKKVKVT